MLGDPYARMISVIRDQSREQSGLGESQSAGLGANPCKLRLGQVTRKVPLEVTVAGVKQPTEVLKINERLTRGAKWKVQITSPDSDYKALTGTLAGLVDCPGGHGSPQLGEVTGGQLHSGDTTIGKDSAGSEAQVRQLELDLEVGDQVLMLTEDDQRFFILMKVVDAV